MEQQAQTFSTDQQTTVRTGPERDVAASAQLSPSRRVPPYARLQKFQRSRRWRRIRNKWVPLQRNFESTCVAAATTDNSDMVAVCTKSADAFTARHCLESESEAVQPPVTAAAAGRYTPAYAGTKTLSGPSEGLAGEFPCTVIPVGTANCTETLRAKESGAVAGSQAPTVLHVTGPSAESEVSTGGAQRSSIATAEDAATAALLLPSKTGNFFHLGGNAATSAVTVPAYPTFIRKERTTSKIRHKWQQKGKRKDKQRMRGSSETQIIIGHVLNGGYSRASRISESGASRGEEADTITRMRVSPQRRWRKQIEKNGDKTFCIPSTTEQTGQENANPYDVMELSPRLHSVTKYDSAKGVVQILDGEKAKHLTEGCFADVSVELRQKTDDNSPTTKGSTAADAQAQSKCTESASHVLRHVPTPQCKSEFSSQGFTEKTRPVQPTEEKTEQVPDGGLRILFQPSKDREPEALHMSNIIRSQTRSVVEDASSCAPVSNDLLHESSSAGRDSEVLAPPHTSATGNAGVPPHTSATGNAGVPPHTSATGNAGVPPHTAGGKLTHAAAVLLSSLAPPPSMTSHEASPSSCTPGPLLGRDSPPDAHTTASGVATAGTATAHACSTPPEAPVPAKISCSVCSERTHSTLLSAEARAASTANASAGGRDTTESEIVYLGESVSLLAGRTGSGTASEDETSLLLPAAEGGSPTGKVRDAEHATEHVFVEESNSENDQRNSDTESVGDEDDNVICSNGGVALVPEESLTEAEDGAEISLETDTLESEEDVQASANEQELRSKREKIVEFSRNAMQSVTAVVRLPGCRGSSPHETQPEPSQADREIWNHSVVTLPQESHLSQQDSAAQRRDSPVAQAGLAEGEGHVRARFLENLPRSLGFDGKKWSLGNTSGFELTANESLHGQENYATTVSHAHDNIPGSVDKAAQRVHKQLGNAASAVPAEERMTESHRSILGWRSSRPPENTQSTPGVPKTARTSQEAAPGDTSVTADFCSLAEAASSAVINVTGSCASSSSTSEMIVQPSAPARLAPPRDTGVAHADTTSSACGFILGASKASERPVFRSSAHANDRPAFLQASESLANQAAQEASLPLLKVNLPLTDYPLERKEGEEAPSHAGLSTRSYAVSVEKHPALVKLSAIASASAVKMHCSSEGDSTQVSFELPHVAPVTARLDGFKNGDREQTGNESSRIRRPDNKVQIRTSNATRHHNNSTEQRKATFAVYRGGGASLAMQKDRTPRRKDRGTVEATIVPVHRGKPATYLFRRAKRKAFFSLLPLKSRACRCAPAQVQQRERGQCLTETGETEVDFKNCIRDVSRQGTGSNLAGEISSDSWNLSDSPQNISDGDGGRSITVEGYDGRTNITGIRRAADVKIAEGAASSGARGTNLVRPIPRPEKTCTDNIRTKGNVPERNLLPTEEDVVRLQNSTVSASSSNSILDCHAVLSAMSLQATEGRQPEQMRSPGPEQEEGRTGSSTNCSHGPRNEKPVPAHSKLPVSEKLSIPPNVQLETRPASSRTTTKRGWQTGTARSSSAVVPAAMSSRRHSPCDQLDPIDLRQSSSSVCLAHHVMDRKAPPIPCFPENVDVAGDKCCLVMNISRAQILPSSCPGNKQKKELRKMLKNYSEAVTERKAIGSIPKTNNFVSSKHVKAASREGSSLEAVCTVPRRQRLASLLDKHARAFEKVPGVRGCISMSVDSRSLLRGTAVLVPADEEHQLRRTRRNRAGGWRQADSNSKFSAVAQKCCRPAKLAAFIHAELPGSPVAIPVPWAGILLVNAADIRKRTGDGRNSVFSAKSTCRLGRDQLSDKEESLPYSRATVHSGILGHVRQRSSDGKREESWSTVGDSDTDANAQEAGELLRRGGSGAPRETEDIPASAMTSISGATATWDREEEFSMKKGARLQVLNHASVESRRISPFFQIERGCRNSSSSWITASPNQLETPKMAPGLCKSQKRLRGNANKSGGDSWAVDDNDAFDERVGNTQICDEALTVSTQRGDPVQLKNKHNSRFPFSRPLHLAFAEDVISDRARESSASNFQRLTRAADEREKKCVSSLISVRKVPPRQKLQGGSGSNAKTAEEELKTAAPVTEGDATGQIFFQCETRRDEAGQVTTAALVQDKEKLGKTTHVACTRSSGPARTGVLKRLLKVMAIRKMRRRKPTARSGITEEEENSCDIDEDTEGKEVIAKRGGDRMPTAAGTDLRKLTSRKPDLSLANGRDFKGKLRSVSPSVFISAWKTNAGDGGDRKVSHDSFQALCSRDTPGPRAASPFARAPAPAPAAFLFSQAHWSDGALSSFNHVRPSVAPGSHCASQAACILSNVSPDAVLCRSLSSTSSASMYLDYVSDHTDARIVSAKQNYSAEQGRHFTREKLLLHDDSTSANASTGKPWNREDRNWLSPEPAETSNPASSSSNGETSPHPSTIPLRRSQHSLESSHHDPLRKAAKMTVAGQRHLKAVVKEDVPAQLEAGPARSDDLIEEVSSIGEVKRKHRADTLRAKLLVSTVAQAAMSPVRAAEGVTEGVEGGSLWWTRSLAAGRSSHRQLQEGSLDWPEPHRSHGLYTKKDDLAKKCTRGDLERRHQQREKICQDAAVKARREQLLKTDNDLSSTDERSRTVGGTHGANAGVRTAAAERVQTRKRKKKKQERRGAGARYADKEIISPTYDPGSLRIFENLLRDSKLKIDWDYKTDQTNSEASISSQQREQRIGSGDRIEKRGQNGCGSHQTSTRKRGHLKDEGATTNAKTMGLSMEVLQSKMKRSYVAKLEHRNSERAFSPDHNLDSKKGYAQVSPGKMYAGIDRSRTARWLSESLSNASPRCAALRTEENPGANATGEHHFSRSSQPQACKRSEENTSELAGSSEGDENGRNSFEGGRCIRCVEPNHKGVSRRRCGRHNGEEGAHNNESIASDIERLRRLRENPVTRRHAPERQHQRSSERAKLHRTFYGGEDLDSARLGYKEFPRPNCCERAVRSSLIRGKDARGRSAAGADEASQPRHPWYETEGEPRSGDSAERYGAIDEHPMKCCRPEQKRGASASQQADSLGKRHMRWPKHNDTKLPTFSDQCSRLCGPSFSIEKGKKNVATAFERPEASALVASQAEGLVSDDHLTANSPRKGSEFPPVTTTDQSECDRRHFLNGKEPLRNYQHSVNDRNSGRARWKAECVPHGRRQVLYSSHSTDERIVQRKTQGVPYFGCEGSRRRAKAVSYTDADSNDAAGSARQQPRSMENLYSVHDNHPGAPHVSGRRQRSQEDSDTVRTVVSVKREDKLETLCGRTQMNDAWREDDDEALIQCCESGGRGCSTQRKVKDNRRARRSRRDKEKRGGSTASSSACARSPPASGSSGTEEAELGLEVPNFVQDQRQKQAFSERVASNFDGSFSHHRNKEDARKIYKEQIPGNTETKANDGDCWNVTDTSRFREIYQADTHASEAWAQRDRREETRMMSLPLRGAGTSKSLMGSSASVHDHAEDTSSVYSENEKGTIEQAWSVRVKRSEASFGRPTSLDSVTFTDSSTGSEEETGADRGKPDGDRGNNGVLDKRERRANEYWRTRYQELRVDTRFKERENCESKGSWSKKRAVSPKISKKLDKKKGGFSKEIIGSEKETIDEIGRYSSRTSRKEDATEVQKHSNGIRAARDARRPSTPSKRVETEFPATVEKIVYLPNLLRTTSPSGSQSPTDVSPDRPGEADKEIDYVQPGSRCLRDALQHTGTPPAALGSSRTPQWLPQY